MWSRSTAETGRELWAFDPMVYRTGSLGAASSGFKHRGVAVWGVGENRRIFINARDTLFGLDAATGELIGSFGDGGRVLLTEDFPNPVTHEAFDQTSPPVVFDDLVIIGSRVPDQVQQRFDTPGSVQAFDVHTGERRWVFYTIPQSNDEFGADTWGERVLAVHRPRKRLGVDVTRRGTRPALHPYQHAKQRLLRADGGWAPICSPNRSSASMLARGSVSGTFRRCTTGCGTMTSPRRQIS